MRWSSSLCVTSPCSACAFIDLRLSRTPQASAERPARWQVRCRVCHHAAAQTEPGPAKDAYLVSLEAGNATAPGYVVLRADKKVLEAEASIFEARSRVSCAAL